MTEEVISELNKKNDQDYLSNERRQKTHQIKSIAHLNAEKSMKIKVIEKHLLHCDVPKTMMFQRKYKGA